jgi:hypothetical protein
MYRPGCLDSTASQKPRSCLQQSMVGDVGRRWA